MTTKQEIQSIENKLEDYRTRWKTSSPAYKKVIEQAAKLLKEKKKSLEKKLENEALDEVSNRLI